MKKYSNSVKATMIKRMCGKNPKTATAVALESGISQATLSRWLSDAGKVDGVRYGTPKKKKMGPLPKRSQDWTTKRKLAIVAQAAELTGDELGAFLRREGVHAVQLDAWMQLVSSALENDGASAKRARRGPSPELKRIRDLERELHRKEKALAEAAALLILKKKFETVFGEEELSTGHRNDK